MSNENIKILEEERLIKPVYVFGKDITQIKCFRKSFIYGICFGVAGGLGAFLFTSRAIVSYNVAVAGLWIGLLGYWVPCRYQYETSVLKFEAIRKGLYEKLDESNIKNDS